MNPYVVLFNSYGTGTLGDAVVYGPFAELEEAESYADQLRQSIPLADRDRVEIEIESIQSPPALRLPPTPRRLIDLADYPIMQRVDSQTGEPIGPPIDIRKQAPPLPRTPTTEEN